MKTTHEVARELLALPDVPLLVEMWCRMEGYELVATITGYSEDEAIIWQRKIEKP